MIARSLGVVFVFATLAACSSSPADTEIPGSHTGRVWEASDIVMPPAEDPERWPVGGDWVMVVPEVYEAQLSEALYGLPAMPEDYGHIPHLLIESEWSELSEVAWTDKDGYFDVDVEEGDYWVCMGYSGGRPYDVVDCVLRNLGRVEAQFEWNMGNLY